MLANCLRRLHCPGPACSPWPPAQHFCPSLSPLPLRSPLPPPPQFWRQKNGGALSGDNVVALAIEPGTVVNEVFDVSPPYPDAPGVLAGFLYDDVALALTEQGPQALEQFVLKRWAQMMNDDRILTQVCACRA